MSDRRPDSRSATINDIAREAARAALTPLEYMRKFGAFEIAGDVYGLHQTPVPAPGPEHSVDGMRMTGFPTPSRKLELYSRTLKDWGWGEHALPGYIRSHVHPKALDRDRGERAQPALAQRALPQPIWEVKLTL